MLPPLDIEALITRLIREDWGRLLAALVARTGNFALAEDSLQDAVVVALEVWPEKGPPCAPDAWLISVAHRKALDRLRRSQTVTRKEAELALWLEQHQSDDREETMHIPDHRLELIFACCHPAIEQKSQVALTLRSLGGLSTEEIARAYLDKTPTMAARLTRAKKKLSDAGVGFKIPERDAFQDRTAAVLKVIYLIFNEGLHSTDGQLNRAVLVAEAIRLGRILTALLPDHADAKGLLALMLLGDSRRQARRDENGSFVPLEHQIRTRWDQTQIAEGAALVKDALSQPDAGVYAIEAAISALHAQAASFAQTDWPQIVALYGVLARRRSNPIVMINQSVAVSYVDGPEKELGILDQITQGKTREQLELYQPFHVARADFLARLGRNDEAAESYRAAIALSDAPEQTAFLEEKLAVLERPTRASKLH